MRTKSSLDAHSVYGSDAILSRAVWAAQTRSGWLIRPDQAAMMQAEDSEALKTVVESDNRQLGAQQDVDG